MYKSIVFALLTLFIVVGQFNLVQSAKTCEVCTKELQKILDQMKQAGTKLTQQNIEKHYTSYCENTLRESVENRLCYYLGGLPDSATKILPKMSVPLSWPKPVDKICEDLRKVDSQICELRYEVQIDVSSVDLKTLRVRDLRKILSSWGQKCDGCIEKEEFIKRIEELKPQFAPKQEL